MGSVGVDHLRRIRPVHRPGAAAHGTEARNAAVLDGQPRIPEHFHPALLLSFLPHHPFRDDAGQQADILN